MSAKSDSTISEALGVPITDDVYASGINFSSAATSGYLEPNSMYRFAPSEDCYIQITQSGQHDADTNDTLMFGGLPEVFSTTGNRIQINVIRKSADGVLSITKLLKRGL